MLLFVFKGKKMLIKLFSNRVENSVYNIIDIRVVFFFIKLYLRKIFFGFV